MRIEFTKTAEKDLKKLDKATQKQIIKKLRYLVDQKDPLKFAVELSQFRKGGDYRFRIGSYRAVFDIKGQTIYIIHIEHRKDVYR